MALRAISTSRLFHTLLRNPNPYSTVDTLTRKYITFVMVVVRNCSKSFFPGLRDMNQLDHEICKPICGCFGNGPEFRDPFIRLPILDYLPSRPCRHASGWSRQFGPDT